MDRLKILLLVLTGSNAPGRPKSEANQIVSAWDLFGMNEGHGFRKKQNRDYQAMVETMFWKKCLLDE